MQLRPLLTSIESIDMDSADERQLSIGRLFVMGRGTCMRALKRKQYLAQGLRRLLQPSMAAQSCRAARVHHLLAILLLAYCWQPCANAQSLNDTSPDVLKKLSIEELLNINIEVTSVSKRPEKLSETASAVQVITSDAIQRSGATSLPEALRLASNLEVAQINAHQWAVSSRGLLTDTANELLVLIDGRSLYMPRLAGVYWDVQDIVLADVDRIEVISGPGATLWGANAVNGVINIITKSSKSTQGGLLVAASGNELKDLGAVRYGGVVGASDFTYRVYLKHQDRDGIVTSTGADINSGWGSTQGGFRTDGALSERDTLTVQGDIYSDHFRQVVTTDVVAKGDNLLARWSRTLADDAALNLQLYYDHTYRNTPNVVLDELSTYDLDFEHHFVWDERHSIVWGAGYRRYDSDAQGQSMVYIPQRRLLRVFSGFVQDEIALRERLKLTLGTKLEHNDYTGVEVQPSLRLAWLLGPEQTVWGAISRAVRTPSRIDRDQYIPAKAPYTRLGSDQFVSEELLAYELGYRIQPHSRLSLAIATFYDDYDKLRSFEQVNPPAPTPTVVGNGQQAKSYGAELTAEYRPTAWWQLRLADTEIRMHIWPRPGSTDTSYGANEAFDPRHQVSLRSAFDLPHGWKFDAAYRHVSKLSHQSVPAYGEMDLRLGWQVWSNLELSLMGQNLLHAHHAEFIAGGGGGAREIERSIYGKLLWNF
jgi:iron complex outermembrane receptor protein